MFKRIRTVKNYSIGIRHIAGTLIVAWTLVITGFLIWEIRVQKQAAINFARTEAIGTYNKDLVYRRWATLHGGVYVPITEKYPPNPYLKNVSDREILTPSGKRLTLVNPAYMTRQVHELALNQYSWRGHITSLNLIRPQNQADEWEKTALHSFSAGQKEVYAVSLIEGKKYFRLMRPIYVEKGCLKCHGFQDYKVGEVRGGISVSVPLAPYNAIASKQIIKSIFIHLTILLLGLAGLGAAFFIISRNHRKRLLVEARFKRAMDASQDGLFDWDLESKKIYFSPGWKRMLGYGPDEPLDDFSTWETLTHPDDAESFRVMMNEVAEEKRDRFKKEFRMRHKNGHWVDILSRATLYRDKHTGRVRIVGTHVDISERKQIEKKLRQAQKMESIGNLASGIAHDFNNILFPVIGMSELLLEDLAHGSAERKSVEEIFKAGKRGSDLVKQILAFSRQSEHRMAPIRIQNVLKDVLKLLRSTIPSDIEIKQDIQTDCGLIMANSTQIHQVIMNLITNAFHAVEKSGGSICVGLKEKFLQNSDVFDSDLKPGYHAALSVSDTGQGIPPEISDNIFDPYFTTKDQGKGTGLGLSIVHGIVQEHHGDIKFNTEIGTGTTFIVYIPLMNKTDTNETIEDPAAHPAGNERILLVDDEESVAKLGKLMLNRLGYDVTIKNSSLDALQTLKRNPDSFDLVITDMTMPNMTGDKLAKEIMEFRPDLPIIICTGFSERINQEKAETFGIKGFLMKPVVKSDLAQMVRKVLDEPDYSPPH